MVAHIVASALASFPAYAAIDLGTNNCRLLIGAVEGEGYRVVDSFSRFVRLGEGLAATGRLHPHAMERALVALHGCAARLRRRPVAGLHAVATEACRQASNGRDFLRLVQSETGLPIEVVTARQEVELALESCGPLLRRDERRVLLFDIGGGSTEVAWVGLEQGRARLIGYCSLPLGVATLADQVGCEAETPEGFAAMVAHVAGRLETFETVHCITREIRRGGVLLLGTSGTATTLAAVALGLPCYRREAVDGMTITAGQARAALAHLQGLGPDGRAAHPCVGAQRAGFLMAGCALFEAIRSTWPAGHVLVADRGLREGMLLRQIRARRPRRGRRG